MPGISNTPVQETVLTVMPAEINCGARSPGFFRVMMVWSKVSSKGSVRRSMFSHPPFPSDWIM